jgi:hypothetical protein
MKLCEDDGTESRWEWTSYINPTAGDGTPIFKTGEHPPFTSPCTAGIRDSWYWRRATSYDSLAKATDGGNAREELRKIPYIAGGKFQPYAACSKAEWGTWQGQGDIQDRLAFTTPVEGSTDWEILNGYGRSGSPLQSKNVNNRCLVHHVGI